MKMSNEVKKKKEDGMGWEAMRWDGMAWEVHFHWSIRLKIGVPRG
jgi:hypothetical protein